MTSKGMSLSIAHYTLVSQLFLVWLCGPYATIEHQLMSPKLYGDLFGYNEPVTSKNEKTPLP